MVDITLKHLDTLEVKQVIASKISPEIQRTLYIKSTIVGNSVLSEFVLYSKNIKLGIYLNLQSALNAYNSPYNLNGE